MEGLCESCNVFLQYIPIAPCNFSHSTFNVDKALQDLKNSTTELSVNVNCMTEGGHTPLLYAVFHGHSQCVKTLIDAGAIVNKIERAKWPPLIFSAGVGDCRSVQLLLETGADVNESDDAFQKTAILMASQMGNDKCIELLIKAGADANMVYNSEETALAKAAAKSQVNCVKIPLKAGADLNKGGMTPLMKATFNGNIECVRVLLLGGADVNKLHASLTALYYAGNYRRNEIVKLLLNAGADVNTGKNPLVAVLPSSGTHTAKITINAGADVNKVDEQLNTVLHNCASYEYMELLLKADIEINKKNQFGHNALEHYIVKTGTAKEDICLLLHAAGESTGGRTAVGTQQLPVPGSALHEDLKHLCR